MTGFHYSVYGISLKSEFELALPEYTDGPGFAEIEIATADTAALAETIRGCELQHRDDWYHYAHLDDGSSYVRWDDLGEFWVSSGGRRVLCARSPRATAESFHVYLLGQAISFALLKSGFEPLHATAVEVDGGAAAFLGRSGYGKSSMAACFLAAGHTLLTDDLLLFQPRSHGIGFEVYPGPPRLKLFPSIARRFLGKSGGEPMNLFTQKMVIPFDHSKARPLPLKAIYALSSPQENRRARKIEIEALSPRDAFLALVKSTFNTVVVDAARLQRQACEASRLVGMVPIKKLKYPRGLKHLPALREAIVADLRK